ncbi:MAG: VWA domain-containing protein [Deltaproteobacteria bacterium]|nr:VWA domain-containing protein [Deltaproteobacteria bacterium]
MSFLAALALGIAVLVVAPYLAHRLRRQRAEEKPFAATRLVPATPPKARRRAQLEDRFLFAIRALAVVALALLGASPLVRCSRLALSRSGASVAVAIVLDDSMSMRVVDGTGRSRFERARGGAREILGSLRDGDAAAIVLAGHPARVGLASTTDIGAARAALDGMAESDRATDLEGAVSIARTLVADLPQVDRRVIVLSDLADGKPEAPPLGEGATLPVWVAMPELRGAAEDCGILSADRAGGRARVRFACSSANAAAGRSVEIRDGDRVLATAPLPQTQSGEATVALGGGAPAASTAPSAAVTPPAPAPEESKELVAVLTGKDAIASDDRAPVVVEAGPAALAVVGDRAEESVATGGAPVVEQALAALHVEMAVRPIPQVPDRREDTAPFAAILVDDPPGFTPEQRRALTQFVEGGGVLLVALGRRAASAPLGANLEPALGHAVTWDLSPVNGVDVASGATLFGEAATSLADLAPRGRAKLADQDVSASESLIKWADGAPLVARRTRGRGDIWMTTLPFSVDASDFALRPGFLALLDAFVLEAKQRASPRRGDVGTAWTFAGARQVEAVGPKGAVEVVRDEGTLRLVPAVAGAYRITIDGASELRVAAPLARELDLRPRGVAPSAASSALGGGVAIVDVSWVVALVLLALVAAELVTRAMTRARSDSTQGEGA